VAGLWDAIGPYVEVVLPTLVVALIFWFVMKAIFNADRRERQAEAHEDAVFRARVEAARARRAGSSLPDAVGSASAGDRAPGAGTDADS